MGIVSVTASADPQLPSTHTNGIQNPMSPRFHVITFTRFSENLTPDLDFEVNVIVVTLL